MHPEGAVERAVDDHVGRRVDDEQDVAERQERVEEKGDSIRVRCDSIHHNQWDTRAEMRGRGELKEVTSKRGFFLQSTREIPVTLHV